MFVFVGGLMAVFHGRLREARHRTEQALAETQSANARLDAEVQRRTAELESSNAALRAGRMELEAALESIADAVFITDAAGRFVDFNQAFATIHRFPNKAACAKTLAEYPSFLDVFLPSGERAPLEQWAVPRALRGETVRNAEYGLRRRDTGETWTGSYSFAPIRNAEGAIVGSVCVGRDVTEQKQADLAFRRSQEFVRLAHESADIGIWHHDLTSGRVHLDERAQRHYGVSSGDLTMADVLNAIHPADRERLGREVGVATAPGASGRFATEYRVVSGADAERWLAVTVRVEFEGEGAARRATMGYGTSQDVTARRQAEAALRESETRLRLSVQSANIGLWDWDLRENTVYFSPEWKRQLGHDDAEISNELREWEDRVHPDDLAPALEKVRAYLQNPHGRHEVEMRMRHKDGSYRWIYAQADLMRDAEGQPMRMLGCHVDITERRLAAAELERLNGELQRHAAELEQRVLARTAALEAANRELESFSYSVSHDLRAPLRAIDAYSHEVLADFGAQLSAEGRRLLGVVRESAQEMGNLIDDLLAFSRLGRKPLDTVALDTTALVQSALATLRSEREGRQVQIEVGELPPCHGDVTLLKQVWINLLSNALKYTRHRERAVVEIGSRPAPGGAVYHVRDNGAGFDMRYAGKLFGVFQRLHRADEYPGTGVGLAIVERIVSRHGGRVWAEAAVDQGATFYFTLNETGPHHS